MSPWGFKFQAKAYEACTSVFGKREQERDKIIAASGRRAYLMI